MAEFDLKAIKSKMLRKFGAFGSVISSIKYQIVGPEHPVTTAATDGKTIYCNGYWLSTLSEQEQLFVFSHEVCHIALNHILRSKDKDQNLWNIATDAYINAHLRKDGLPMVQGGVDMPDAIKYSADEIYQKLLEEKKQKEEQAQKQGQNGEKSQDAGQSQGKQQSQDKGSQGNSQEQQSQNGQGQSSEQNDGDSESKQNNSQRDNGEGQQNSSEHSQNHKNNSEENQQAGHDEHSMWADAVKQAEQQAQEQTKAQHNENGEKGKNENPSDDLGGSPFDEKTIFEEMEKDRIKKAEEVMSRLSSGRRGSDGVSQEVYFDDIGGASRPVTNWKRLLRRYLTIDDEQWGHKFSDKASHYAARIEDVERDELAETEIILDTSGSVSVDLLKSFLRQVKTILKDSKIKVGTFSDEFYGFVEIKRESDIDKLRIRVGGGTNFDSASRAFSARKDVNRICFTDGADGGDAGIRERRKDIIWISFENPNFKPDDGKVIFVPQKEFDVTHLKTDEHEMGL